MTNLYPEAVCDRCDTPVEDYGDDVPEAAKVRVAEIDGEDVCIDCRKDQLYEETVLSEREAHVQAAKEITGRSHAKLTEILKVEKSTIDEYSSRINRKIEKAERTVELLGE